MGWACRWISLAFVWGMGVSLGGCPSCGPTPPPESPLLALTPTEYNHTICDLLAFPRDGLLWPEPHAVHASIAPPAGKRAGLFGQQPVEIPPWPWTFPAEIGVDHFEGMAEGQVPSAYQIEEYQKAANHFAAFTLVSPVFFTCENFRDLGDAEATDCAWQSILRFTQRAWRRPLTDIEMGELESFWKTTLLDSNIEQAIALTISGVLQSPPFLFKIERGLESDARGDVVALNSWELASRLSYFLWDSMPDPELFAAANDNRLLTREGVATHTRRMLGDPKARSAVISFHHQLLGTRDVLLVTPARRAHGELFGLTPAAAFDQDCDPEWPGILGPIRHSFQAETNLFIERTIFDGQGTLSALLTDNHGYISQHTRVIYGDDVGILNGPSVEYDYGMIVFSGGGKYSLSLYPVQFPPTERAGLLTLPSVLAIGSYPVHPAPILRGKLLLERLACQTFGSPPPGVEVFAPTDTNEAEGTNRQRTEAATSPALCASCHRQLNPPGFAFEHYDALGRWRADDNGFAVDASGSFTFDNGEEFSFRDGVELAYQLADSSQVKDCYVRRWASYAVGYPLEEGHGTLETLQRDFRDHDDVQALLVAITTSDLFRYLNRAGLTP